MQGRVERALVDLEHAAGPLLDPLGDAPPVHGLDLERLEHQHVQRALKHFRALAGHDALLSTVESRMGRLLSFFKGRLALRGTGDGQRVSVSYPSPAARPGRYVR